MSSYDTFLQLHHQDTALIIPNAWNVKSAQQIQNNGYKAIATSSGAIAHSLGYEDGEKIPFDELLYIIKRIKTSTSLPLSVDLERGYADDLNQLAGNIQKLLDCGVSGINIEDAQGYEIYLRKLSHIRNYLSRTNQTLFINARTDVFIQKLDSPLETVIKRARSYADAGADGLFVPAVQEPELIKEIASAISLPLNVVGTPKTASIQALSEYGVKRISMAVLLFRATYNHLDKTLKDIAAQQSYNPLFTPAQS